MNYWFLHLLQASPVRGCTKPSRELQLTRAGSRDGYSGTELPLLTQLIQRGKAPARNRVRLAKRASPVEPSRSRRRHLPPHKQDGECPMAEPLHRVLFLYHQNHTEPAAGPFIAERSGRGSERWMLPGEAQALSVPTCSAAARCEQHPPHSCLKALICDKIRSAASSTRKAAELPRCPEHAPEASAAPPPAPPPAAPRGDRPVPSANRAPGRHRLRAWAAAPGRGSERRESRPAAPRSRSRCRH